MQINSSQLAATKLEVNKSVVASQANAVTSDGVDASLSIKTLPSLAVNDYQDDAVALQSRLGAHVEYENHTGGQRGAVAEYLVNQHAAKREEIQQMVGIDTYA
ncbi:hypothetical protein ACVBIL_02875 [Shewanella sp. 125m-7]